jgi:hypothetical protein
LGEVSSLESTYPISAMSDSPFWQRTVRTTGSSVWCVAYLCITLRSGKLTRWAVMNARFLADA